MPEQSLTPGGVFLSYAREDTDAARRIADALGAFGVDAWFDQSELRGGDSWDTKIKKQIRECRLFVPIVSAATQARGEGYFRREWKLAVERTHDMAAGVPFLLPVVIDDTLESEALVPDELMRVQWTRLARGVPTPEFVEQVKSLLTPSGKIVARDRLIPPSSREPRDDRGGIGLRQGYDGQVSDPALQKKKAVPAWTWGSITAIVVGIATALSVSHKSSPSPVAPPVAAVVEAPKPAVTPPVLPKISEKSIAVLPFANMSEDKDNTFFSDGMHEDILTNLALVHELHVVSRTSVMQYRATTKPIRQIGEELGVAYILEGSVRRAGNKVRVTGQLINARTDEHVWAKAYDRDITDIFAIQAELSQEIARALAAALSPEEKSLLERRPTENLAAYDAYVKARQIAQAGTTVQLEYGTIEVLLQKAVELDPKFAAAWAELGRAYAFAYFSEYDRSPDQLRRAREAIETALRLAPNAPEVIEKYGDYFYYGYRDYARAVEQYQRLAILRPNDAVVFGSIGLIHRRQGRMHEALTELRRAAELEPRSARYVRALQQLTQALNLYDEATALQQRVIELTPGDLIEQFTLAAIAFSARGSTQEVDTWMAQIKPDQDQARLLLYGRKSWAIATGNFTEAIRLDHEQRYYEVAAISHWSQDVTMAFALAAQGDRAAARARALEAIPAIKRELEEKPSATAWSGLAGAYVITGERAEALRCGRKAMELVPEATDAVAGPGYSLNYASNLAWLGDKDAALAELARLLRTPYGENIYTARSGLNWFPLHGDPRFEKLVNDPANNAPLP